jgi:UDP-N-acetylmuramoyl-tripeptide--D-alanyl-D-alanine ligase
VARTKGEIYAGLPADGCAVMNADEPWIGLWREMNTASRVITFGAAEDSDVRLVEKDGKAWLETPNGGFQLKMPLPGRHNLLNAAAATAVALALGLEIDVIRRGLEAIEPVPGRLNLIHTRAAWTVIDDTYNANPASLYSALQVLTSTPGTPWLVLGDMKELGADSSKMHREVGETARVMGVRRLFVTGEMAAHVADTFGNGAQHFESRDELVAALCRALKPGVTCLIKGSRSMGMEAVVQAVVRESELREAG